MIPDENDFFRNATLRISSSLEIERALWRCFLYMAQFIPADGMSFHVLDREAGVVETVAYANPASSVALSVKTALPPHLIESIVHEERRPQVRFLNPVSQDELCAFVVRNLKWADAPYLEMRLVLEGEYVGTLVLTNRQNRSYTDEHARLLFLLHDPFAAALANILQFRELQALKDMLADDYQYLQDEFRRLSGEEIIGADFGLKGVMDLVRQVSPLSSPVLLLGETGAGKEVISRAIHNASPRKDGPFIRVNCGAIPETLIDSELFGHEKGAFTGALSRKRGRFERAHQGTIFLDEIGELPLEAQVRMLRVLQDKEVERVGGTGPIRVDIRVIAATHRDLEHMVRTGGFREDLYYRLNVFPVLIPPLRERVMDIPALAHHFIRKKSQELGFSGTPQLAGGALECLTRYSWPGNVRELENEVERALILSRGGPLRFPDLHSPLDRTDCAPETEPDGVYALDDVVARHIYRVLDETGGRVEGPGGAAELLQINPGTLRHRMRKLGIPFGRKARQQG